MKEKNHSLEFYRTVFTLTICLYHAQYLDPKLEILKNAYLCVEFFFMLSGYLLYRSFMKETEHHTMAYAARRFTRLWPEYIFAAVIAILGRGVFLHDFNVNKALNEVLMVQNTGLFHYGGYNYPCWYIPVMIFCGILIYSILSLYPDAFIKLFAPLAVLLGYTYFGGLEAGLESWQYVGPFSEPMIRGFIAMSLGVLIGAAANKENAIKPGKVTGTVAEITLLVLIGLSIFTEIFSEMVAVISFALLILITAKQQGFISSVIINHRVWSITGSYSYAVYLNHAMVIYLLSYIDKHLFRIPVKPVIYLIVLLAYSVCTHLLIQYIVSRVNKKARRNANA